MSENVPEDTISVTAPVGEIANAYALAAERELSLSQLTRDAWKLLLENQEMVSSRPVTEPNLARINKTQKVTRAFIGTGLTQIEPLQYTPSPAQHTTEKILWGQFARFLPMKYTLRILATLATTPVYLVDWQDAVREHSFSMREHLRTVDVRHKIPRGSQLSAGFPRGKSKKRDRSMERFISHYTAIIQSAGVGPVVGMCAEVGFINVDREDKKVSFTPEGLQYVMLPNPQLDYPADTSDSTSAEEKEFLRKHMSSKLQEDWSFCCNIMSAINLDGAKTSDSLFTAMLDIYVDPSDPSSPTRNTLRTNIGGALGRLVDMGLVGRSWAGRNSEFYVTPADAIDEQTGRLVGVVE